MWNDLILILLRFQILDKTAKALNTSNDIEFNVTFGRNNATLIQKLFSVFEVLHVNLDVKLRTLVIYIQSDSPYLLQIYSRSAKIYKSDTFSFHVVVSPLEISEEQVERASKPGELFYNDVINTGRSKAKNGLVYVEAS